MQLVQLGKYRILEKLGQGAMGEVFRGHDPALGRDVAIKLLTERLSGDDAARQRFQREARAAAQLNHPNIITVHDFGEEQGKAYMAMELLEGTDLRNLIEKERLESPAQKIAILEQILEGLAFAHAKGVVHRDLKPGNIHVLPSGQVKIMDFGLARRTQDAAATGVVMGTPYYMAPEQAEGAPPTARSDIFSIGALAYELLSGKRPFTGPTIAAVLFAVVKRDPQPLAELVPELPAALTACVMRALAKAPEERYADAGEMLRALLAAIGGGEAPEFERAPYQPADESPERPLAAPLSGRPDTPPELREALEEVDSFLADRIPPLMVADSIPPFLELSAEAAASEIWTWAGRQRTLDPGILPLAELLFHALRKLAVLGELELVEKEPLLRFLRAAGEELAKACPPKERDRLRGALVRLGESDMVRTDPIDVVRRLSGTVPPATPGLRRISLLEQRLRLAALDRSPEGEAWKRRVVSQAITAAANEAKNESELEDHLRRLRRAGVASGADQVFRSLGRELAESALPKGLTPDTAEIPAPGEVRAMRQIVSLPEDPVEVARRFRHLVTAASEQFNEGNLGGAVHMFDLAGELMREKKVEPAYIESLQKKGRDALDAGQLRQYMEKPHRHPELQSVLGFYEASLGAGVLLDQLEGEERRDRRRFLLDLLVVHGTPARSLARTRLLESVKTAAPDFARRNWIYLLRLMARPAAEAIEPEIDAVARFASPASTPFLVKEALLYLGQCHHPRAAQGLVSLLRSWEQHLERTPDAQREEGLVTLDRLAAALAREGGARAWTALVDHALGQGPKHGDTMARLGELGSHDLASCPGVVETLSEEIESALPRGVLGRLVARKDQDLPRLVGALASTRTPAVRALLETVARRCAGQEAGRIATRALHAPAAAVAQAAQAGELEPFGMPVLLQRLMETRSTGKLNLLPREGAGAPALIALNEGRISNARWGRREGLSAFYQLLERPFAGNWTFEPAAGGSGREVLGELATLVREGVRRARALRSTSALVGSDNALAATGSPPGTVVDEQEYELIVNVWQQSCAGVPPGRLEAEMTVDAFRIYRPLAQWLEEGALQVVLPAEVAAAASRPGPDEAGGRSEGAVDPAAVSE